MKAFFFSKKLHFSIIFSNFSNLNFSLIFSQKNLKNKVKRQIYKKPFETYCRKNLPHLTILKNFKVFFSKKTDIFFKKNPILNVSRVHIIPVKFYGKFAAMWWKKQFEVQTWTNCRYWRERKRQTSGKKRTHLRRRFCFHILNMTQNSDRIVTKTPRITNQMT